jgi:hypothetical protein
MRQFDVVANPFPQSRKRQPYLIVLQSDLLAHDLKTVVVAPLEPAASGTFADKLNPEIVVEGTPHRFIHGLLSRYRTTPEMQHGRRRGGLTCSLRKQRAVVPI